MSTKSRARLFVTYRKVGFVAKGLKIKKFSLFKTGKKLGYCEVMKSTVSTSGSSYVLLCVCGKQFTKQASAIRKNIKTSCGCMKYKGRKTHNLSKTSEYRIWAGMIARCQNSTQTSYPYYGGRGIKVCSRWLESFENFLKDMGCRPAPEYSLDRIDSDGNYEPLNCRWATPLEQYNNRKFRYMTIRSYQHQASKTAIYPHRGDLGGLMYVILGLVSEVGEIAGKFKKLIRGDNKFDLMSSEFRKNLISEAGDAAWYLSQLAHELDVSLEDIMRQNLQKLNKRQKDYTIKGSGDNR
jgi:NTP pyrophosphatase (non-canonical NTP hydrolase)